MSVQHDTFWQWQWKYVKSVVLGVVVKCSTQSTHLPPMKELAAEAIKPVPCLYKKETQKKPEKNYGPGELNKMGTLKSIIYLACQDSEKIPSDFA